MVENSRDEDVCRAFDELAEQDHTYRMSVEEYFYYKNNWWISLKVGKLHPTIQKSF